MGPETDARLHALDLEFDYGGEDFRLVVPECRIAAGERVVCIGPSGCGKSTFLDLLAGILSPRGGRVLFDGVDWASVSEAERRRRRIANIGLVFQEFELLAHLSVLENVLLPYFVNPALHLDDAAREGAHELLQSAGIESKRSRKPDALSQGERQRVALCRALVTRPSVLLADEPTGNLDPRATGRVLDLLLEASRERGATLVMVTHDRGLLDSFDRVIDFAPGGVTDPEDK